MIVSAKQPPRLPSHGLYWERQTNPFHASAILPALHQAGLTASSENSLNHGPVLDGWMLIDWVENPIGWVADGTEVEEHDHKYYFETGPYGKVVARRCCSLCGGAGAEFPGNQFTEKCEQCDGTGKEPKR